VLKQKLKRGVRRRGEEGERREEGGGGGTEVKGRK